MKPADEQQVLKMSHPELVLWCVRFLNGLGFYAWANRTGAVKRYGMMVRYGEIGSADVACCLPSRTLWCEVKVGRDRTSADQIRFARRVKALGHHWLVARRPEHLQRYVLRKGLAK